MRILLIVILMFVLLASLVGVSANDCEKLAKDYQNEHGGYLIFIQPLKDNGAYDLGEYNGHWINQAYNKDRGVYFYDSQTDNYFNSSSDVLDWYEWTRNKKAEIFNYNKGEVPFAIIWHY